MWEDVCNRNIMMTNQLTKCYERWKRQRMSRGKSGRKKLREGEIESKTKGKHLGTEGSRGGLRLGLRQDEPD